MWETVRFEPRFVASQRGNFQVSAAIAGVLQDTELISRGVSLELSQDRAGNNGAADILDVHGLASNTVGRLGIPLWPDGGHATFLTGTSPLIQMHQWDELARHGLVLDRTAFDTLQIFGETGLVGGASVAPMPGIPAWEAFEAVPENDIAAGDIISMETATARRVDMPAFVLPDDSRIRVLSWFEDEDGRRLSPATWTLETKHGRVVVLPFSMDDGTSINAIANWKRKSQIEHLLEWAARKPLPVKIAGAADLFCVYRETKSRDRVVLALANFSHDVAADCALEIPAVSGWSGWRLRLTRPDGQWRPLEYSGAGATVSLSPETGIEPMSVSLLEVSAV